MGSESEADCGTSSNSHLHHDITVKNHFLFNISDFGLDPDHDHDHDLDPDLGSDFDLDPDHDHDHDLDPDPDPDIRHLLPWVVGDIPFQADPLDRAKDKGTGEEEDRDIVELELQQLYSGQLK